MPNTTVPAAAEGVPSDVHVRNRLRELALEISSLLDRVPLAASLSINPASSGRPAMMLGKFVTHEDARAEWVAMPYPVEELRQVVELYDLYEAAEDREDSRSALHDLLSFKCQITATRQAHAEILLGVYQRDRSLADVDQMLTLLESIAGL